MTPMHTYAVKKESEWVKKGIILTTVPMATRITHVRTPTRSPLVSISQHMGTTLKTKVMVPQLAIMATVWDPHPVKAASTLSLMGPQVFHWTHWKGDGCGLRKIKACLREKNELEILCIWYSSTLSLMESQVFHWTHWKRGGNELKKKHVCWEKNGLEILYIWYYFLVF